MVVLLLIRVGVDQWKVCLSSPKQKRFIAFVPSRTGARVDNIVLVLKLCLELNRGVTNHPRPVLAPGAALGLLLSIALSSDQARITVTKTVRHCNYN